MARHAVAMDYQAQTELLTFDDVVIRGLKIRGRLPDVTRVRRGRYVETAAWEEATSAQRYECFVRATVDMMKVTAPLSRESAAILLDIPVIGHWPDRVHVLEPVRNGGRRSGHITRHGTRHEPGVRLVDGIAVAVPARTIIDLACARTFASGLASADHALAKGLVTREDLETELELIGRAPGSRRAREVVRHADGRAGSVGESLSRAQMITLGLPLPHLQHEFYDDDGFIGRTDFWWEELQLIGEFDGRVKFGRDLAPTDADARQSLWAEKRREDRLRRTGRGMVRWTWDEAYSITEFRRLMASVGLRRE